MDAQPRVSVFLPAYNEVDNLDRATADIVWGADGVLAEYEILIVNSGSSANLITLGALRELYGAGEVLVPTLTWVSDIAAVIHSGFQPVFVDIDPRTLGMDNAQVLEKVTSRTKAVFLSHILGYNAVSNELLGGLEDRGIPLLEDACESHGTTFKGRKVGTFGLASNFSF